MTETGVMVQAAIPDRIIEVIDLGKMLEETVDKVVGKATEMKVMVTITMEIGTDQERGHLQEIIEGIEVLAMIDLDQGPEQA